VYSMGCIDFRKFIGESMDPFGIRIGYVTFIKYWGVCGINLPVVARTGDVF
jgi:hypothetical protein